MTAGNVFLIRETALTILKEIYKQCDGKLEKDGFSYKAAMGDEYTIDNAEKCRNYLLKAELLEATRSSDHCRLSAKGVEVAETAIVDCRYDQPV